MAPLAQEILPDAEAVARRAAAIVAAAARDAVASRGRFLLATSGGATPWRMLRLLASEDVPWPKVHLLQVDERVAPAGHPDRNLTHLREHLLAHLPEAVAAMHAMPVDMPDLDAAAVAYGRTLRSVAGDPPVLDLVHLGLGTDGHTASLIAGDGALTETADVAVTAVYHGRRRLTLTFSTLNRARCVLWVVTGAEKAAALARLVKGDDSIPAGRIRRDGALLVADTAARDAVRVRPREGHPAADRDPETAGGPRPRRPGALATPGVGSRRTMVVGANGDFGLVTA
jgi:6-phosphogluconolactonase